MASLKYSGNANFQTGTLSASYTSGGSSLSLTSGHGSRFPSSGDFWVRVDDEILKCTARSGDTLTVSGAQDGTSAANHASGSMVRWVLSAAALDQLRTDQITSGAFASASAAKAGNLYVSTDGYVFRLDGGASFTDFGPVNPIYPFVNADFSDFNTPTVTTFGGGVYIKDSTVTGNNNIRGRTKAVPTAPYTITMGFRITSSFYNNNFYGLGFTDGTKVKVICIASSGGAAQYAVLYYTNLSTFSASRASSNCFANDSVIWMSIEDDTTNWKWRVGTDPSSMTLLLTESRNTDLTATSIGLFLTNERTSLFAELAAFSWRQQ